MTDTNQRNKDTALALWAALDCDPSKVQLPALEAWQCHAPFGLMPSAEAVVSEVFAPLRRALPDLERQVHLFVGGVSSAQEDAAGDGAHWVAGTGYYTGRAVEDVFGIPTKGQALSIRWGEFLRFNDAGQITYAQTLWDFVDWFEQIGRPALPQPRGVAHVYPAPTAYDGVLTRQQDAQAGAQSLQLGRALIFGGLNRFDESDLTSMGMARFFHPNIKWYGPGGIGACLSLRAFEALHQQPWLIAFPDRKVMHLESLFAEDRIVAASGPRGVVATHRGTYLGHPATDAAIEVSGLDFWLRTGDRFTENWVFVDMIHLFAQMGVDLFARMRGDG